MTGRIIVLGASGRIGKAAAEAFRDAGWTVRSLVRTSALPRVAAGTEPVELDARDRDSVIDAAQGCDVVLHALNLPYTHWPSEAVPLADTAIAAAERSGATLLFPGNLYNFGSPLPRVIDETTPMRPSSRKGALRVEVERRMAEAAGRGARVVILRAGDFIGGGPGSWLDRVILKDLAKGRVNYPGPLDLVHEWAYTPDLAATFVRLAEARDRFEAFATFGFPGYAITGHELIAALNRVASKKFEVGRMPWLLLRLFSPVVPVFRELTDVAYLWLESHRIDGAKLTSVIGEPPQTPLEAALAAILGDLAFLPRVGRLGAGGKFT